MRNVYAFFLVREDAASEMRLAMALTSPVCLFQPIAFVVHCKSACSLTE